MLDTGEVLVWEWLDHTSIWKPYSTEVAHYIKQVLRENPRAISVSLGEVDEHLTSYILDLISMNQFRLDTGTLHPVRVVKFPLFSAPGRGVTWEWEEYPGYWVPFETRLSVLIQKAFELQQPGVRLGEPCSGSHICFQTMSQVNFPSQKRIRVRSRVHCPYPAAELFNCQNGRVNGKPGSLVSSPGLGNSEVCFENANHALLNANHVLENSTTDQEDYLNLLANVNHKMFNCGLQHVNTKQDLLNCNQILGNNHCLANSKHELVYSHSGSMSSDHELSNCTPRLMKARSGLANSSNRLVSPKHGLMDTKPGLVNSSSRPHTKPQYMRSVSIPDNSRFGLLESNFKPDRQGTDIMKSNSNLENSWPGLMRSNSRPASSNTVLVNADSRSASFRSAPIRPGCSPGESPIGFAQSKPRTPNFRSVEVWPEGRPAGSVSEFVRSNYRSADPPVITSNFRSVNYVPELINIHSEAADSKLGLTSRGLNRSTSLRAGSGCACPQCILVKSVKSTKSASWPGRHLDMRPGGVQQSDTKQNFYRGNTRIPAVAISNIEGSGKIPPALAGIGGLLMSAAGLPVCLSIARAPILRPPPVKKRDIQPIPGILGSSRKVTNRKSKKPEEIIKQFLQRVKIPPEEDCDLCLRSLAEREVGKLYRCSHTFHIHCLAPLYRNGTLRCPSCQALYGKKLGSQPPGKMSFHLIPHSLPGHHDCQTIRIIYHIPPGIQGYDQPNPGKKFTAADFPLHCYLPNTDKGRMVLQLLIEAWERRLLFPLISSHAAGVPDCVSTSRIPQKTEFGSNLTGKGFPDPRYLDSVLRQLQDWVVTKEE
ncbi:E3 ubiquitin-protein ligase DTX4-like [Discoglossus pictus]